MTSTPLFVSLLLLAGGLSLRNYMRLEVAGKEAPALARLAGIAVLLVVLLAPAWIRQEIERRQPRVEILVDRSASMDGAHRPGSATRYEVARRLVEGIRERYGDAFEYRVLSFDRRLREGPLPESPDGDGSDLAAALQTALRREDPRTRATFLVSDGRSTRGANPALVARSAPRPLHALALGGSEGARPNVSLRAVEAPEEGFRGGAIEIRARVGFDRVAPGVRIPLELRVGSELLQTTSVAATSGETEVRLTWNPQRGGLERIEVRLLTEKLLDDRSRGDDRAETSIRVRDEPIPLLLLGGRPGPDLAFLRRVLEADPRFRVEARQGFGSEKPVELPPPDSDFALEKVPLVILSGFSAEHYPASLQEQLTRYVTQRRGALFLLSNGPREWRDLFASPLAPHLPFLPPREYQGIEKRFVMEASLVDGHPVTRILDHPQANRQAWQRLPPITPGLPLKLAAGARELLAFPYYPRNLPALATRSVSGGMVLAMNSRESYLWSLLPRAHGDPEEVHERFLARLVAWAADPAREGGETLETSRLRFHPGETVRVLWKGPEGGRPERLVLRTLESDPDAGPVASGSFGPEQDGEASGELEAPEPGFYRLEASSGESDPVLLAVHASREERLAPDPDPDTLRAIAEASGGSFLALGAEAELRDLPALDATPVVRPHTTGVYWLDEAWVLALCLGLFCLEWGLRRRRSLV